MIEPTDSAKQQVAEILDAHPGMVFRVEIVGGGCSGFKYNFDITEKQDDDIIVSNNGLHCIVTDCMSDMYLATAQLDYKIDIFTRSFVLINPDVKATCGCGESVAF
jgi:iron-sulfur cluster insertion protein